MENPTLLQMLETSISVELVFSKTMGELILCFTHQGLNELPWSITMSEYLKLQKIEKRELS